MASGGSSSCALRSTGQVACWGTGAFGELGNGVPSGDPSPPVTVIGLTDATQLTASDVFACARRATGQAVCWGANWIGNLGNGSLTDSSVPVDVTGLTDATQVAAGTQHACAARQSGQLVCWGDNGSGALGDGTTQYSLVPVAVSGL